MIHRTGSDCLASNALRRRRRRRRKRRVIRREREVDGGI